MIDPDFLKLCGSGPSSSIAPGVLPFTEKRTVLLDDSLPFRATKEVKDRIRKQRFETSIDEVDEKLLRRHAQIAFALTGYYGIEEHIDDWTYRVIARVLFSPWGGEYHGFVNDFLQPLHEKGAVQVRTDNPHADWWLFVAPEGVPGASLLTDRAYLFFGHVFPPNLSYDERISVFAFSERIAGVLWRRFDGNEERWQALAQSTKADLCRYLNEVAAEYWTSPKSAGLRDFVARGQHQSEKL